MRLRETIPPGGYAAPLQIGNLQGTCSPHAVPMQAPRRQRAGNLHPTQKNLHILKHKKPHSYAAGF